MENNSDKEMRDKLQGMEFPFDPKAWEQMESMLNEDRKPRAFFWWWFGGVAACLLLATGILGYYQLGHNQSNNKTALALNHAPNGNNDTPTNANSESSVQHVNPTSVSTANNEPTTSNNNKASEPVNSNNSVKSEQTVNKTANTRAMSSSKTANDHSILKKKSAKNNITAPTNNVGTELASANETGKRNKGTNHKNNITTNGSAQSSNKSNTMSGTAASETLALTTGADDREKLTEPISLDPTFAYLYPSSANDIDGMKKQNTGDVNLKKLKKKIFNYSIGIEANISGSTLGHQTGASVTDAFNRTPSYMVGFTHDFMFFKRFAITNSILLSQTSFRVFDAKTTYPTGLIGYTSNITELTIPIGIKAYAISKPKFRFYLATGIINHIKLKETFDYKYANNYNLSTSNGFLPSQNQFTGNQDPTGITALSLSNNSYYGTYDVSINHGNRYYISFSASAGAEFIVKKHCVFFTEPLFYMALQKVGVQDKYKYNLGLTGGVRYQF